MGHIAIRRARSDEAEALSALAFKAKASWGYSPEFMEACRAELTFTPGQIEAWTVWVAEADGARAGMVALIVDGQAAEVEDFFVDEAFQGRGVGRALMQVLLKACRTQTVRRLCVTADPHAESIYARLGFARVGETLSGSIAGRLLPRMELQLGV